MIAVSIFLLTIKFHRVMFRGIKIGAKIEVFMFILENEYKHKKYIFSEYI